MRRFGWFGRLAAVTTLVLVALAALAGPAFAKKPGPSVNQWSAATAVSPSGNPDPTRDSQLGDVAVSGSGLAVAAWDQYWYTNNGGSSIGVAVQQAGGSWGAPITVSDTNGFALHPRVAVGGDGTAAIGWTFETPAVSPPASRKVQVAVRLAGSTTWTVSTLATGPLGGVAVTNFVGVGVDQWGDVTAAWTRWDGTRFVVQASTKLAGGAWPTTPTTLSGPSTDALYPSLAVNARGDAAVAYSLSPYSSYPTGTYAQVVTRTGPSGVWSAPMTVSETIPSSVGYVTDPQVALDASGLATVIYFGYGIEAARQLTPTTWTAPAPVIRAPNAVSSYLSPDLAVDAAGNAVVAVSIFDATVNVDRASVWVTRGTSGGMWSPAVRVTDPTVPVDAYATRVAMSPDGSLALVGWIDHYHGLVQSSRWTGRAWGPASAIGRSSTPASFQEVLALDVASPTQARTFWKTQSGTQWFAASYRG